MRDGLYKTWFLFVSIYKWYYPFVQYDICNRSKSIAIRYIWQRRPPTYLLQRLYYTLACTDICQKELVCVGNFTQQHIGTVYLERVGREEPGRYAEYSCAIVIRCHPTNRKYHDPCILSQRQSR